MSLPFVLFVFPNRQDLDHLPSVEKSVARKSSPKAAKVPHREEDNHDSHLIHLHSFGSGRSSIGGYGLFFLYSVRQISIRTVVPPQKHLGSEFTAPQTIH